MACLPELPVTCLLVGPAEGIPGEGAEGHVSSSPLWSVFYSESALPTGSLLSPLHPPSQTDLWLSLTSEGLHTPSLPLISSMSLDRPPWKPLPPCQSILPSLGTQLTDVSSWTVRKQK